jgi:hypothetical protein
VGSFPKYDEKNPEPVHLALAHEGGAIVKSIPFAGHPAWIKIYIAKQALNLLRLSIMDS